MDWLKSNGVLLVLLLVFAGVSWQNYNIADQARDKEHSACVQRQATRGEGNKRAQQSRDFRDGMQAFVDLTRERRADPKSTSYDLVFVHGIDKLVTPKLDKVHPTTLPPISC